jgi:hypothetical protein
MIHNHWLIIAHHKWLCIMMCYAQPSGWELWCAMPNQWLWIMVYHAEPVVLNHGEPHHDSEPLAQNNRPCFTTTDSAWHTMIHNQWFRITHHDSQSLAQNNWASGCESWGVMMSQWLWIMMCYAELVVIYHSVLFWANGCESWCVMLN